ncbi:MAG: hypothetical protein JXQ75_05230 [Phycisphaerae bacterium]|nr:hypothetical protein [Phycisphaerae bacterium]
MRRFILPLLASLAVCAVASADLTWELIPFTGIDHGAVSYKSDPLANVVVSGTSFYDTLTGDGYLGVQSIGGDGIDNPVSGNFAVYGVFQYSDPDNILGLLESNPNTPFALEIAAHTLQFSTGGADYYHLDAKDMAGTDYLKATLADLSQWGYTDIADAENIWLDFTIQKGDDNTGVIVLSVVAENAVLHGDAFPDFDALVGTGVLDGQTANWVASGLHVAMVPVPGAVLLGLLGLGAAGPLCRRKRS